MTVSFRAKTLLTDLHDDTDPGHLACDADGRRRRQGPEEREPDGAIDGRQ